MAGEHRYSSSLFIQSGAVAQFKNGITSSQLTIEGSVTAEKFLLPDGTIAGTPEVFFAGAPGDITSGISRSAANGGPESKDSFIGLGAENTDIDNASQIALGNIFIQATGSDSFKPNFFNFIKLGDDPDIVAQGLAGSTVNATTVQQGGLNSSSYTPISEAERQTGVHRYIIFAAETGPNGKTHQVFHTVTIDAFSNLAPVIESPPITAVTLSMAHNQSTGSLVLHLSNSFDPNQNAGEDDFLTEFKVERDNSNGKGTDPTVSDDGTIDSFNLSLDHKNNDPSTTFANTNEVLLISNTSPGLTGSEGHLHFTASIANYNAVRGLETFDFSTGLPNTIRSSTTQNQDFKITLKDNFSSLAINPGETTQVVSMAIVPPPTASIRDINLNFEGSDNFGGFTDVPSSTHEHILLYDNISTLTSSSISSLPDRYTSSLVRVRTTADIRPPENFSEPGPLSYHTRIQIRSRVGDNTISDLQDEFEVFKINTFTNSGFLTASTTGSSKSDLSSIGEFEELAEENNGYHSVVFTPDFTSTGTPQQIFLGTVNDNIDNLQKILNIRHGLNDHCEVVGNIPNPAELIIHKCPDILIKNPKVQISLGSKHFVNDLSEDQVDSDQSIDLSLLYGLATTLQSHQTESQIMDPLGGASLASTHPQIDRYVTESIVKLRVLADIIEPFGPAHNKIDVLLTDDSNTHGHTFVFHTGSENPDLKSVDFNYTTDHGYDDGTFTFTGKELLRSSYTSSWVEFNFTPNSYTFTALFTRNDGEVNLAGVTSDAVSTATLNLSATPDTIIDNLDHETETFGYSGVPTNNTIRTVLYGDSHQTNNTSESKSWKLSDHGSTIVNGKPLADTYASHSVTRYKVSGRILEPLGPGRCSLELTTDVDGDNSNPTSIVTDNLPNVITEADYTAQGQLITNFTSNGYVGKTLTLQPSNYGGQEEFTIGSSAITYIGPNSLEPDNFSQDNSEDTSADQLSSTITVFDTPKTQITDVAYETETHGYSKDPVGESLPISETFRTVLYGFPHHTTVDSSSFENHDHKITYSSHSIARFRIKAKIVEPIGYLHSASSFEEVWVGNPQILSTETIETAYDYLTVESFEGDKFVYNNSAADDKFVDMSVDDEGTIVDSSGPEEGNWQIDDDTPGSGNTGPRVGGIPSTDTTSNEINQVSGEKYLRAEASSPANGGYQFILRFPKINFNQTNANEKLIFYYNANGAAIGRFRIYASTNSTLPDVSTLTPLNFEYFDGSTFISSNQIQGAQMSNTNNVFYKAVCDISSLRGQNIYLYFHYTNLISPFYTGDFAVDNILISGSNTVGGSGILTNETFSSTIHFETGSHVHQYDSSSDYDSNNRLVSLYTSSYVGRQLSASTTKWSYTSGAISHNPDGENGFEIFPSESTAFRSASVLINDTEPTQYTDIEYETETFGYSGVPTNDTTRVVLYGDNRITNDGTGSGETGKGWDDHINAHKLASSSVSRFRFKFKTTEPLGPLEHTSSLVKQWSASADNVFVHNSPIEIFNSNPQLEVDRDYDNQTRLIIAYTGSYEGKALNAKTNDERDYLHTGSIVHEPEGENSASFTSPTTTNIKVKDTPPTEITITKIETETEGESNIAQVNPILNPDVGHVGMDYQAINRVAFLGTSTLVTGSGVPDDFTASVVSRFRILADIKEPLGVLHEPVTLTPVFEYQGLNPKDDVIATSQQFATNSADLTNPNGGIVTFGYDTSDNCQLTSSYTSSFIGTQLTPTDTDIDNLSAHWKGNLKDSGITHNPSNQNGFISTFNEFHPIKLQISSSASDIDRPLISELRVEVEETSGSLIGTSSRNVNIPHGLSATPIFDSEVNSLPINSRNSLVRARILCKIEEMPGPSHNITRIKIGGYDIDQGGDGTEIISFATNSADVTVGSTTNSTTLVGKVTTYTSSFLPFGFSASANTSNPITNNAEEKTFTLSASVFSYDGNTTQGVDFDVLNATSFPNAVVNVTGALSSSTIITLNTSSNNLSSSTFAVGEEETLYYLHNSNFPATQSNLSLLFSPTLETTAPPFTFNENLIFPDNLDISYELINDTNTNISQITSNGTASLVINRLELEQLNNPAKVTLITTVTNREIGNGTSSIETPIFIIPAQPPTASGHITQSFNYSFNNNKLFKGALPSESFEHYKEGEEPINPTSFVNVNNILITSKSDGTGNDYSMSFSPSGTPDNFSKAASSDPITVLTEDLFSLRYNQRGAFSHGDSGSLIVKINGVEVVNYDLQSQFNTANKGGDQTISSYTGDGTASFNNGTVTTYNNKGKLVLNRVSPYNNVSQSLFVGDEFFPNGFQAYDATIFLDEKMRDGYNFLEFTHSIDNNREFELDKFEWYYDDGIPSDSDFKVQRPLQNDTMHENRIFGNVISDFALYSLKWDKYLDTNATFSVSGVSYFQKDAPFLLSLTPTKNAHLTDTTGTSTDFIKTSATLVSGYEFVGITNIANKTYRKAGSKIIEIQSQDAALEISSGSNSPSLINNIILDSKDNKNGLRFFANETEFNDKSLSHNLIPSSSSTASIENLIVKNTFDYGTSNTLGSIMKNSFQFDTTGPFYNCDFNLYKGYIRTITFKLFNRTILNTTFDTAPLGTHLNYYNNSTEITLPIGRFIDTSSFTFFVLPTDSTENFHTEEYRWDSASWANDSLIEADRDNYKYFLTASNSNFNSAKAIKLQHELPQSVMGCLLTGINNTQNLCDFEDYSADGLYKDLTNAQFINTSNYLSRLPNTGSSFECSIDNVTSETNQKIANRMNCTTGAAYCRAFVLPGIIAGTINQFKVKIVGNFRRDNISNHGASLNAGHSDTGPDGLQFSTGLASFAGPQGLAGKFYKVEMRLPGPVNSNDISNSAVQPGTKWGVLSGGTNQSFIDSVGSSDLGVGQTSNNWKASLNPTFIDGNATQDPNLHIENTTNMQQPASVESGFVGPVINFYNSVEFTIDLNQTNLVHTNGVVLIRISINNLENDNEFPGVFFNYIKSVEISPI